MKSNQSNHPLPGVAVGPAELEALRSRARHLFAEKGSAAVAQWWEAMADVRLRQSDLSGAAGAMLEAVRRRQIVVETPWVTGPAKDAALADCLFQLGSLLARDGKSRAAAAFVDQSAAVLAAVGLPSSDRKSVLNLREPF